MLKRFFELFTVMPDLQNSINIHFVFHPRLDDLFIHQYLYSVLVRMAIESHLIQL